MALDDARLSFDNAVDSYDSARPSYPDALFADLFELLPSEPQIIEVGPGTGKATTDLLSRGAIVHGIEIGSAMAARLRVNLTSDRLRVTVGDFETVTIAPGEADALFAATAYHWVSPSAQTQRPAQLLRRGGLVAVVDLIQVNSPDDAGFFVASRPVYERYGQGHRGPAAPGRDRVEPAIRQVLDDDNRFGATAVHRYDWNQSYSASQYRQLMLSYSATQLMDEPQRAALLDDMELFIRDEFGGSITRPLVVTLTTAALL